MRKSIYFFPTVWIESTFQNKITYPAMSDQYHCEPEGHSQQLFVPQLNPEFCLHSQSDEQNPSDTEYVIFSLKCQKKDEFIRV